MPGGLDEQARGLDHAGALSIFPRPPKPPKSSDS
jgi:hypothetical protein